MQTGYIHINQAVRKYNKTRQTFYNYINKGYVKTKKVNNKIFLHIPDIENILNDYIATDKQTIIEPDTSKTTVSNATSTTSKEFTSSQNSLIQGLQRLEDSIKNNLLQLEQDLLRTHKNQLYTNQQSTKSMLEEKLSGVMSRLGEIQYTVGKNGLKQRKIQFRIYYLVFVSINIFILWYIS